MLNRLDKNYPNFIHKLGITLFACVSSLVFILAATLLFLPQNEVPSEPNLTIAEGTTLKDFIVNDVNAITANDDGTIFHIKTEAGFKKLGEYSNNGSFDSSWTYYLDDSIFLNINDSYTAIGGYDNPFEGTFDGQGNTITVVTDNNFVVNYSFALFGNISSCTIQNLDIVWNIQGTFREFYGLYYSFLDPTSSLNVSHVSMSGYIDISSNAWGTAYMSLFGGNHDSGDPDQCDWAINLYDININMEKIAVTAESSVMWTLFGDSYITLNANSCNVRLQNSPIMPLCNMSLNVNISNSNFDSNSALTLILYINGTLNLHECQFKGGDYLAIGTGSVAKAELYDCAFIAKTTVMLLPMASSVYYSGVYTHVDDTGTTTILDPDFTSYKWCIDTHLNDGLPQLRRFVSIGDFMEQCNMQTWASEKSKA